MKRQVTVGGIPLFITYKDGRVLEKPEPMYEEDAMQVRTVALTWAEYDEMLVLQTDPKKHAELVRAVSHESRESGDKIYVDQKLIDGLRTPIVREEDIR